jgi:hypothetical protein
MRFAESAIVPKKDFFYSLNGQVERRADDNARRVQEAYRRVRSNVGLGVYAASLRTRS